MSCYVLKLKKKDFSVYLSSFYHICIALLPVLYIINVPGLNMSLGTIILLGFLPYSFLFGLKRINDRTLSMFPFLVFYLYLIFRSTENVTRIVILVASYITLFGHSRGAIRNEKLRSIIEAFAIINVALLIVQVIGYYIFHIQIQYIPRGLISEEYQNAYVFREFTGSLYRPSALFLEPSHYAQYCVFALISALFPESGNPKMKKAIAIGAGCILTTSGMGIALTFGVFVWYAFLNRQSVGKKAAYIIKRIPVVILLLILLSQTEFFQAAVQRIFSSVDNYNAISGRTHNWDDAIGTMHGNDLWLGYGDSAMYKRYLTGLADTIYKYGVICVILEGLSIICLILKKFDNFVCCCCVVFVALFCVAHLTNFVAQVFYFGLIIADARTPLSNRNFSQSEAELAGEVC